MEWARVATAPSQLVAEMWQQALREEGIPSMLSPNDTISFLGVTSTPVRLMVPAELESSVQAAMEDLLSDDAPSPEGETDL